jgi:hypothetical protein
MNEHSFNIQEKYEIPIILCAYGYILENIVVKSEEWNTDVIYNPINTGTEATLYGIIWICAEILRI